MESGWPSGQPGGIAPRRLEIIFRKNLVSTQRKTNKANPGIGDGAKPMLRAAHLHSTEPCMSSCPGASLVSLLWPSSEDLPLRVVCASPPTPVHPCRSIACISWDFTQPILNLLHCFLFFFFFLAIPRSMQDLSSLTRDQTHAPCSGSAES